MPEIDIREAKITYINIRGALAEIHYRHYWEDGVKDEGINDIPLAEIAINPTFWQCLGKALGWHEKHGYDEEKGERSFSYQGFSCYQSVFEAHRLFHIILTNQDPAPFWNEILSAHQPHHE